MNSSAVYAFGKDHRDVRKIISTSVWKSGLAQKQLCSAPTINDAFCLEIVATRVVLY
jgi:hypothetical protein